MSSITNPTLAGHVIQDAGVDVPQREKLNFVGVTIVDNPGLGVTEVTITASASQTRAFAYFVS